MKAKIKATGEIVEVYERYDDLAMETTYEEFARSYSRDELDFSVSETRKEAKENANTFASETAVLEGYVARDEEGYINLFQDKPTRDMYDRNDVTYGFWDYSNERHIKLPTDSFPSVTWQSEPKKVRITLEAIEE